MPLTQFTILNAKPSDKDYKLSDGEGLHLLVQRKEASSGVSAIRSAVGKTC